MGGVHMKLKSILAACMMAAMGLAGTGSAANAVVYPFNNVLLSDGGLLNGTLDIQFGGVFGYSLTTTGGTAALDTTYTYPGFPGPSSIPFGSPTTVQLFPDVPVSGEFLSMLQLTFLSDLMVAAPNVLLGGIGGPSFECNGSFLCPANIAGDYPIRFVAADTPINPTPLPPAAILFGTALAGLGLFGLRRRVFTHAFG